MAFAVLLRNLLRDRGDRPRVVPIIPDEARTFGMDGLFKEVKIYAPSGPALRARRLAAAGFMLTYSESKETARSWRRA